MVFGASRIISNGISNYFLVSDLKNVSRSWFILLKNLYIFLRVLKYITLSLHKTWQPV